MSGQDTVGMIVGLGQGMERLVARWTEVRGLECLVQESFLSDTT